MRDLTPLQHETLKILLRDTTEKEPISGFNMSKNLNLKKSNGGDFRSIVHALRIKGYPICANGRGYFYARTDEQLSKFITKLQARVISQEEALKGLKQSFHNVGHEVLGFLGKENGAMRPMEAVMVNVRVRVDRDTVRDMRVPVDSSGSPVIPPSVEVI